MQSLKERIVREGKIYPGNILKVDSFLNHQIDVALLEDIGASFYEAFNDQKIDKILTIEASGIAVAVMAARYFKVPVVFAKKSESKLTTDDQVVTMIHSYTKDKTSKVQVAKAYLKAHEKVLIVDDFLANGEAALGLIDLIHKADAEVAGIAIVIEKGFQEGGAKLRAMGHRLVSLAIIDSMEDGIIRFR